MGFDHLNLVTVDGQAETLDGKPARGSITFASTAIVTDQTTGQAVFPVPLKVSLDVNDGSFSIDLPATDDPDLLPVGWVYSVTVDIAGSKRETFNLAVPYDTVGSVNLFLAAPNSSGVYMPAPSSDDLLAFALFMGV